MVCKSECYTYFTIVGDFPTEVVTELLGMKPRTAWNKGDVRHKDDLYDFSRWSSEKCSVITDCSAEEQMRRVVSMFDDKRELLEIIRKEYDVSFYLVIVPKLYADESTLVLSPPMEVIDFCHDTRTEIDLDLYIMEDD